MLVLGAGYPPTHTGTVTELAVSLREARQIQQPITGDWIKTHLLDRLFLQRGSRRIRSHRNHAWKNPGTGKRVRNSLGPSKTTRINDATGEELPAQHIPKPT
jgi:hypothetical protein